MRREKLQAVAYFSLVIVVGCALAAAVWQIELAVAGDGPSIGAPEVPVGNYRPHPTPTPTITPTPTPTSTPSATPTPTPTPTPPTLTPTPTPTPEECVYFPITVRYRPHTHDKSDLWQGAGADLECLQGMVEECKNLNLGEASLLPPAYCINYLGLPGCARYTMRANEIDDCVDARLLSIFGPYRGGYSEAQDGNGGYRARMGVVDRQCRKVDSSVQGKFCPAELYMVPSPISLLWNSATDINDSITLVSFALDPGAMHRWFAWKASADAPLLVYDPKHQGKITSADQLFGNWTFGGKRTAALAADASQGVLPRAWRDGYEALAELDADKSGAIEGSELAALALWFDRNQDGISQPGEVSPLARENVVRLFYTPDRLDAQTGDIHASVGYERLVGGRVSRGRSVDWFGRSYSSKFRALLEATHLRDVENVASPDDPIAAQYDANAAVFNGLWLWKLDEENGSPLGAKGIISFRVNEQGISGRSYLETPLEDNRNDARAVLSRLPMRGLELIARGSGECGKQRGMRFHIIALQGETTRSVACISDDGYQLAGTSEVELGAAQKLRLHWSATRVK